MQPSPFSPDVDIFSTPPTTPNMPLEDIRPSLSRRSSRPSNLRIQYSSAPNIVVDQHPSPMLARTHTDPNGDRAHASPPHSPMGIHQHAVPSPGQPQPSRSYVSPGPATSPYFVHSQLQGASFKDYLHEKQCKAIDDARMEHNHHARAGPTHANGSVSEPEREDDSDYAGSLTRQLAETAVGVREMSKQLGRTRVHSFIHNVLIVTKARDNRLIKLTRELALYLMLRPRGGARGIVVYVDAQLRNSRRFDAAGIEREHPELFVPSPRRRSSSSSSLATNNSKDETGHTVGEGQLRYWTAEMCSRSPHLFDFVITLGGDGTVLFTSWLFQRIVPPVLPFALGSLGFLTNFDFADHRAVVDSAIDGGIRVNLRMRFTCTVYRAVAPEDERGGRRQRAVKKGDTGEILMKNVEQGGWEALESGCAPIHEGGARCGRDKEIMCYSTRPVESFEVINDLVVDRGPSPYVSLLELFGDEHHLTTVQADGLCISTPTGSTAYSLSAGGSLVHPEIPAMLITPICPHTLSFRPMLLPDSMELRICVPFNSRSTAWASFDGRGRVELKQGDHIKVTASKYPFPTVCADTQSTDWFNSISRTLKWNERERQKSFVVVEESPSRKQQRRRKFPGASGNGEVPRKEQPTPASPHVNVREKRDVEEREDEEDEEDEEDDDEDDEDDEKYDINDLSSTDSPPGMDAAIEATKISPEEETLGREKAKEDDTTSLYPQAKAEDVVRLLSQSNPFLQQTARRSRSRTRPGTHSGLETPDRFAGPHPHPPKLSPRHVQFANSMSSSASSIASTFRDHNPAQTVYGERAAREEGHGHPRRSGQSRSRTPRTRDADAESLKTPTPFEGARRRMASRSRSRDRGHESGGHQRRAFAVWGQDESDSAASDSDA
ncbi:hypothetical protein AcV7_004165 [Taiwanofungus camphoratus]|nr:hypothetical protein AcV7_004165 [Antrodia cinnamomea]